MLYQLLPFEFRYLLKKKVTLLSIVSFVAYGILTMTSKFQFLDYSTIYNDGYNLSLLSGIISLGSVVPCLFLTMNSLLRDLNYNFEELLYSSSITKKDLFVSRLIPIMSFSLILCTLSMIGVFVGTFFMDPINDSRWPFEFMHYFRPWLFVVLPNVIIVSSIVYSSTILGKRAIWACVSCVFILGLYWVSAVGINSPLIGGSTLSPPEILNKMSLLDIFGLASFFEQTQFLTPLEKNDFSLSLSKNFLWNRAIWLSLGVGSLLFSYRKYSYRTLENKKKRGSHKGTIELSQGKYCTVPISPNRSKVIFDGIRSLVRVDIKIVKSSLPFLVLLGLWVLMLYFSFNSATNRVGVYGSRYPTTDLIVGIILEVLPAVGIILAVYYSSELVWRTRDNKISEIVDVCTLPNFAFYLAKLFVLLGILSVFISCAVLTGIAFQSLNNYFDWNLLLYISVFYFGGIQLFLYVVFFLLIQIIVPNKYLGMLLCGLVIFVFGPLSGSIGIEHPLLLFNNLPSMVRSYSDFNGFGLQASRFNWFSIYWIILSFIFVFVGQKYWKRGKALLRLSMPRWSLFEVFLVLILLLMFLGVGGEIYHNVNVLNKYSKASEEYDFNESYERKYKSFEDLVIPKMTDVNTEVSFFTENNTYAVCASLDFINDSENPISEIFVTAKYPLSFLGIEGANRNFFDSQLGTYFFEMATPLLPGETFEMCYELERSSTIFNIEPSINSNGSYIKSSQFNPVLGYINQYEIQDKNERRIRGLPPLKTKLLNDEHLNQNSKHNFETVHFEALVSTSQDQIAFTSGDLLGQWNDNGRKYSRYRSKEKIDNHMAYFSADYNIESFVHRNINVEFYYHPEHYRNIAEMAEVTKATIDYCTDNFGQYPHDYLRIGEIPASSGPNGQAMAGVISINENIFKKNVEIPNSFNVVARVLIHEISHQWWGLLFTPKKIEGALFLSESLAKYTETVVLEKLYGRAMVSKLSKHSMRRYFSGRSRKRLPEPPLFLTAHQQYLAYSKGAIVLSALRELLGEDKLNSALQRLISKYSGDARAISLDLIEELYLVAPEESCRIIDDWLKEVITYDLAIKAISFQEISSGEYEILIAVESKRYRTNDEGKENLILIDEFINIGMFDRDLADQNAKAIYLKAHRFNKGENTFRIVVDQLPELISIDPFLTRLDRRQDDNSMILVDGQFL